MKKVIELGEDTFLIITYYLQPKAAEHEIYESPPNQQFPCKNRIDNGKLCHPGGIISLDPGAVHKLGKQITKLREEETVLNAEEIRR